MKIRTEGETIIFDYEKKHLKSEEKPTILDAYRLWRSSVAQSATWLAEKAEKDELRKQLGVKQKTTS